MMFTCFNRPRRVLLASLILLSSGFLLAGESGNALQAEVQDLIVSELAGTLDASPGDITLKMMRFPDFGPLSGGGLSVSVTPKYRWQLGYQLVWVSLQQGGREIARRSATVDVTLNREVLVARVSIRKGQTLTPDLFAVEVHPLRRDDQLFELPALNGGNLSAARYIQAGTVLSPQMLNSDAMLRRGSKLTLQMNVGNLVISVPGIIRRDSRVGDLVEVKCEGSSSIVTARLASPELAVATP